MVAEPLLEEALALVVRPTSNGSAAGVLRSTPVVLSARPSRLREIIDGVPAQHGVPEEAVLAIVSMVAQSLGCTVLPYSTIADEVDRGELQTIPLSPVLPMRRM